VRFHFEPRRMNTVPVRVRFLGEGQNGYTVANYHERASGDHERQPTV
jgi:hypothetical protein